ncbi:MAG: cyclodeaminase/cyclohydrolase family protein [Chloroflexi bacterium]|nr:cyclodeaminase/cyclohydrolase family protein [Chloroflexota bacterium]
MYADGSLREYLAALASDAPEPGGGSAAACVSALAAALGSMVCHFTVGRSAFAAQDAEMRALLRRLDEIRGAAVDLVDQDAAAYRAYGAARALPRATDAERLARDSAIQAALSDAVRVPLRIAVLAADALALCEPLAERGNPRLLSDVGVAALCAEAGLRSALINVRVNLPALKDDKLRAECDAVMSRLVSGTRDLPRRLTEAIDRRQS